MWDLIGRSVARERALPAAPSVVDRVEKDREAFGRHVDWVVGGGRYRTTDTPRQAAMTLRRLEEAQSLYEAQRAIDDPACMVPFLLDGDAIRGEVANVNDDHRTVGGVRTVRRALLALDTDDPVVLPSARSSGGPPRRTMLPWEVVGVSTPRFRLAGGVDAHDRPNRRAPARRGRPDHPLDAPDPLGGLPIGTPHDAAMDPSAADRSARA